MILPLPFGTIVTAFGEAMQVPEGLSPDEYEGIRQRLQERIEAAQTQSEEMVHQLTGKPAVVAVKQVG